MSITAVGVGSGGTSAVGRMIAAHLQGVKFIAVDTDAQALEPSKAATKIALARRDDVTEALDGADIVFIVCGEGGETGTQAAPVIAEIAKREIGALTVGAVTKPFEFEGKQRMVAAEEGITRLRQEVDTLIVVPAEAVVEVLGRSTILDAYRLADEVLHLAARSVADLVSATAADGSPRERIRSALGRGGLARFGVGFVSEGRIPREASRRVPASPFLGDGLRNAEDVILNLSAGAEIGTSDLEEAVEELARSAGGAEITAGTSFDSSLNGGIRASVIAIDRSQ